MGFLGHRIVASSLYESFEHLKGSAKDHNHLLLIMESTDPSRLAPPDGQLRGWYADAMKQQGESIVKLFMQVPVVGKDPIKAIDTVLDLGPLALLGQEFQYEKAMDEHHSEVTVKVHQCFFKDFFARHNRNFLTRVACSWYHTWGQHVDVDRHKIRFSRLSCMCEGSKCCTFHFERMQRIEDLQVCV